MIVRGREDRRGEYLRAMMVRGRAIEDLDYQWAEPRTAEQWREGQEEDRSLRRIIKLRKEDPGSKTPTFSHEDGRNVRAYFRSWTCLGKIRMGFGSGDSQVGPSSVWCPRRGGKRF